jgi:hypothetical protein
MNMGGISDPDMVGTQQLHTLAAELNIRPNSVARAAITLIDKTLAALPQTVAIFADRFGDSPVLERLPIIIRKQIRRVKTNMK